MGRLLFAVAAFVAALYAVFRLVFPRRERIAWEEAPRPGKIIELDGEPIHYVEQGSGPAVILIHGFGGHTYSFRHQVPVLARHYRVIAIDLLGFGYSGRPRDADYGSQAQAARIVKLMDALGIGRAALAGHSMGGAVVMRAAANWPGRVEKLALVASTSGDKVVHLPTLPIVKPFLPAFARLIGRRILRRSYHDPSKITDEVWEEYTRPATIKGSTQALYRMLNDFKKDPPIPFDRITAPVLIIEAAGERVLPAWMRGRLLKRFPDAARVTIAEAGHLLMEEQPEAVSEALLAFLKAPAAAKVKPAASRPEPEPEEVTVDAGQALGEARE
jgi:pimeloyl-ACP methyl ester carboxylesterase